MSTNSGSDLLLFLVPIFILLMLFEWFYFHLKNRTVYSLKDTLANISCGAGQAIFDSLALILLLSAYQTLQSSLNILILNLTPSTFLLSFLAVDLSYYVYHRLSHKIPWMWAIHVAHHSSSKYNFSVGLRQAWFHKLSAFPFYLILIFTGLPAETIGLVIATHAALQLLTHTQAIKHEIPLIRWIFVTPSHHRVHHGCQSQYLDKNFSGIFSFWDRLFRSYEPEVEPVVFGITPKLQTYNPWNINTHFWHTLFPKIPFFTQISKLMKSRPTFALWIFIFVVLFLLTLYYLSSLNTLSLSLKAVYSILLLLGFSLWGALLDADKKRGEP